MTGPVATSITDSSHSVSQSFKSVGSHQSLVTIHQPSERSTPHLLVLVGSRAGRQGPRPRLQAWGLPRALRRKLHGAVPPSTKKP